MVKKITSEFNSLKLLSQFTLFSRLKRGFTIVELVVVISIIGILATIVAVSYSGWQTTVATAELKSDLATAATAMESYRTFNNSYPTSVPSTFTSSPDVRITGGSTDVGVTFCINATSIRKPSLKYYFDSTTSGQGAQAGMCTTVTPIPTDFVATVASSTSINLSWTAITGATNYVLQRDTNSSFTTATQIASQSGTTFMSSGLSQGTTYYFRVNETNPDGTSDWSDTASAITTINVPTAPTVTVTLSGSNILATISPAVTCTGGTIQYGIRSRTNDGTWGSYSAWSSTTTASQAASDGVKYGYQAQDRCHIDATNASSATVTGIEGTYIDAIATPTAPTVAANTAGATTTYTWSSTCLAGTTARYQYTYYTSAGYNSGWVANATGSFAATTSSEGYTYSLFAQTQCYSANATSAWSASSNTAAYSRPVALYYYNKYYATRHGTSFTAGSEVYGGGQYMSGGSTSSGYNSYAFSSTMGYYGAGGTKPGMTYPSDQGTIYIVGAYGEYSSSVMAITFSGNYSSNSSYTASVTSWSAYAQGTLIQSNIVAAGGTYPDNGQHTDGYWYVKGARAN